jgi:hypothetical protein
MSPQHSGRERVAYSEAARAARAAFAKAAPTCSRFDLRVVIAVVSLTALYSRLTDYVAIRQVAGVVYDVEPENVTGFQRDRVTKSLRGLSTAGIVLYRAGHGQRAMAIIGVPKAARTQVETDPDSEGEDASNTGPFGRGTQVDLVAEHSTTGGPSEKTPEKVSEERAPHKIEPSSSDALPPVEVLDPERDELLRDQGERGGLLDVQAPAGHQLTSDRAPYLDLTSRLIFALKANGSRLAGDQLDRECDAAVRRALAKLPPNVVDSFIVQLHDEGAQYPSALDAKTRSAANLDVEVEAPQCGKCGGRGWLEPEPDASGLIARNAPVRQCPGCRGGGAA